MARGRGLADIGGFCSPIWIGGGPMPTGTGGLRRPLMSNPRGRTLGWIGLLVLLKELFNAAGIT